jgi:hypothetical protein
MAMIRRGDRMALFPFAARMTGLAGGLALILFPAGPTAGPAQAGLVSHAASAAAGCPAGASGGPLWRVCTKPIFMSDPAQLAVDGTQATIALPCSAASAPDFKRRFFGGGKSTTDEGYAYFSYGNNAGSAAFEVGLEHNSKSGNAVSYKLYAAGVPGNPSFLQAPGQLPCGSPLILLFAIGDNQHGSAQLIAGVLTAQQPRKVLAQLQLPVPVARPWVACQCRLSMVTAIAQNGPHGGVPTPLPDGASYGPVAWSGVQYLGDAPGRSGWQPLSAADIQYSKAFTGGVAAIPRPAGTAPDVTVGPIRLPCSTQATRPDDYWTC